MILLNLNDKIKGDSQVPEYEGWITCDTVAFGVDRNVTISGGDRETSNPVFQEITVSKSSDKASCDLFWQACGGSSLGKATIVWLQTAKGDQNQEFMKVELAKAIVTGCNVSSGGELTSETITIGFSEIKVHYTQFKEGETPEAATPRGWHAFKNSNKLVDLA